MFRQTEDQKIQIIMQLVTWNEKQLIEKLVKVLLEKDVLEREDMVEVLGPRPWSEKTSYDDFVAGTSKSDKDDDDIEDSLPVGLHGWDSPVTKDDTVNEEVKEPVVVDSDESNTTNEL